MSEEDEGEGASTGDAPQIPAQPHPPPPARRWGWPLLVGGLAAVGVLLAVADTALYGPALDPYATFLIGPSGGIGISRPTPHPSDRFVRTKPPDRVIYAPPLGKLGQFSLVQALRAFLSNGAGLVLVALAVLVLFPNRVRVAVERLEGRHGPEIALAAGVATFALALGAGALLRFTLFFIAVIPALLIVALGAALFGIACLGLAAGRFLQLRLRLGPAHPLLAALVGALLVFDLAVIPYAGAIALAVVAIAGLGLAVVTRFGSESGWSFRDLDW